MRTSLDTATARSQRREARRRSHHLVTADENSLADLELFIATLPLCASGRIFIEVPEASDIGVIEAPGRMTVTWLARGSRTGAAGTGRLCAPGQALATATCAWADEMLCDDEIETRVTLLGGFLGTADIVEHLTDSLGIDESAISVPESYGLLTR
ncbi:SIP domain-containing protein [Microbacterium sp. KUDC0406]|uniref:SIP domain-containing protein n=1 Tax=Microbacterium sp. KUDC0406 TaxID=2909588 RepID=UPI001F247649|nr:SIP domain-containing protein [Microbacterium sp. KUDC0406]UJP11402.1 SIP domain-containing protein [Microbacterium sp. KUDC0406]